MSIFKWAITEVESQGRKGPCTLTALSFLCSDTCHLSAALTTDRDLLQSRWGYVTTIMTFPTNSMENSSFLISSQHPLRSSSLSKTKQPRFLYFHFQPAKFRAELCVCRVAFSHFLHKIQPQKSTGSVTVSKWAARMLEQMLILLLYSVSFYFQLYLHCVLQSCKTYLMTLSPLPLLYWNGDRNLDSSH